MFGVGVDVPCAVPIAVAVLRLVQFKTACREEVDGKAIITRW